MILSLEVSPEDFFNLRLCGSIFRTRERENLVRRILTQMGRHWKRPTWEEYEKTISREDEYLKHHIKQDFDMVIPYLSSPTKCAEISEEYAAYLKSFK